MTTPEAMRRVWVWGALIGGRARHPCHRRRHPGVSRSVSSRLPMSCNRFILAFIVRRGLWLGAIFDLDPLADDSAADGTYEFSGRCNILWRHSVAPNALCRHSVVCDSVAPKKLQAEVRAPKNPPGPPNGRACQPSSPSLPLQELPGTAACSLVPQTSNSNAPRTTPHAPRFFRTMHHAPPTTTV